MNPTAFLSSAPAWGLLELLRNFFTHKDFLPPAEQIPGTMFTPLHFCFAAILSIAVIAAILAVRRLPRERIRLVFIILWATLTATEAAKLIWECFGREIRFEWNGSLPIYPCSIWMYAMPFVIWGKGRVKDAACGYICTLGLLGGLINFVYPATILGSYSALSFPGFQTFFYHGAIVFTAFVLLTSGYHSLSFAKHPLDCLLPAAPAYLMSLVANTANVILGTDYMFFRCKSFFLSSIGDALPLPLCVILAYVIYAVVCCSPYFIAYAVNKRKNAV